MRSVDMGYYDKFLGKYGDGAERRAALGEDYAAVQRRVDEMMKSDSTKHSEEDEEMDELYHHGIKGQKWGVRRFENKNGTLTAAGKKRYGEESDLYKNLKSSKADKRAASKEYNKAFNKAYYKSSNTFNYMTKKGRKEMDDAWEDAYDKGDKYDSKRQAYKDAKKAYKDEYKKNLKEVKDNANLKDKLLYNDATRNKTAKLMTKYKDMSYEEASKQAKKEAIRNTAIVAGVLAAGYGAYKIKQLNDKATNGIRKEASSEARNLIKISNWNREHAYDTKQTADRLFKSGNTSEGNRLLNGAARTQELANELLSKAWDAQSKANQRSYSVKEKVDYLKKHR